MQMLRIYTPVGSSQTLYDPPSLPCPPAGGGRKPIGPIAPNWCPRLLSSTQHNTLQVLQCTSIMSSTS